MLFSEVIWIIALFLALKIAKVYCKIPHFFLIATIPTLVVLVPIHFFLKLLLSTAVMFALMLKLTDAEFFPDSVLVVGVSNALYLLIGIAVLARFG